jgi:hypothetical protein
LANLFSPLWVIETPQPDVILTPPLHRRQSFKRQQTEVEKKGVLLKAAAAAHMISEVAAVAHSRSSRGPAYPWQSFRDHHSVKHVLLHYHPRSLDNYEYFIGRNTTTMTLDGYRVCTHRGHTDWPIALEIVYIWCTCSARVFNWTFATCFLKFHVLNY